jgi:SAM-dependent methyltransferase
VLGFSNRFVWQCPTPLILDFYNQHISGNHLDVGVGTGYFLDKCRFTSANPRIALMDLNPNSLDRTAHRLHRYRPTTHVANVLEPVSFSGDAFDSIGLNYLIHCLPGNIGSKSVIFENLKPLLKGGGVMFGTTVLGQGVPHNFLARRLMKAYNQRGIFSNEKDNLLDLKAGLNAHFADCSTHIVGNVAFFAGHNPSR